MGENILLSAESWFHLWHVDCAVTIFYQQDESMDWEDWHTLGPLALTVHGLIV